MTEINVKANSPINKVNEDFGGESENTYSFDDSGDVFTDPDPDPDPEAKFGTGYG